MRAGILVGLLLALAGACGGTPPKATTPARDPALYDRLGRIDAIKQVVEQFVATVQADTRINAYFEGTDIPRLKSLLADQICEASGGPCKYTGKNMREAHLGMGVKKEDFAALLEDLSKTLDANNVAEADKKALLKALGVMEGDIVGS